MKHFNTFFVFRIPSERNKKEILMSKRLKPAVSAALFFIFIFTFILQAELIFSSDRSITQERQLEAFDRIELDGSGDVFITVGEQHKVTVSADLEQLDKVTTANVGRHRLLIDTEEYDSDIDIRVDITVPELEMLAVFGSGDVEIKNLEGAFFDLYLEGSGDVNIEGMVSEIEIAVEGSGDVDASDLKANNAYVEINGSGDVRVYARETLYTRLNGSGDIQVYGRPENHIQCYGEPGNYSNHWKYPAIPAIPAIPEIPSISEIPIIPELIVIPEIPLIPEIPEIPEVPQKNKNRVWY